MPDADAITDRPLLSAERTVTYVARYMRMLGIVQLVGINLIGVLFLALSDGIRERRPGARKGTFWLCGVYEAVFVAALIWSGFRDFEGAEASIFWQRSSNVWIMLAVVSTCMVILAIPIIALLRPGVREQFLTSGCSNCGYDLRGAEHEVCPECGRPCE